MTSGQNGSAVISYIYSFSHNLRSKNGIAESFASLVPYIDYRIPSPSVENLSIERIEFQSKYPIRMDSHASMLEFMYF